MQGHQTDSMREAIVDCIILEHSGPFDLSLYCARGWR